MEIIDAHAHIYERLCGYGPRGEARAIGGGMIEWATGYHPDFKIDGELFKPFLEFANELGLTVVFDTGSINTKGFQPEAISKIAGRQV